MPTRIFLRQIDQEVNRIKEASHPNFVHVLAVEREKTFSFVVLEWLEGFPLVDLLRARRALTLREMLMLLKQIAPAVDAARELNQRLEMNLRNILVHFPESFAEPAANVVLRCPLDEWPTFVIKMSLLAKAKELEALARSAEQQTIVSEAKPQRDVVQLGILAYELLGGKRGGFAPLANVSEEGNEILRKCLTPDRSFSSARDFCDALGAIATAKSGSPASNPVTLAPGRSTSTRLNTKPEPPVERTPTRTQPDFSCPSSCEEQWVSPCRGSDRPFADRRPRLVFWSYVPEPKVAGSSKYAFAKAEDRCCCSSSSPARQAMDKQSRHAIRTAWRHLHLGMANPLA